ncbi:MAG: hypothetical protein ACI9WC_002705, partial [Arenicella sp.]
CGCCRCSRIREIEVNYLNPKGLFFKGDFQ